ncbi:MAG: hypothetical protein CBE00_02055 [Planctomycetaceae bacterium TMED240]|nr:hypothetical protein [Rhodopirellula sp.]OUX08308.1 MAG: hypothetical protein CBE00_02055 [Planctomycetaceae bacterium TMED240]
MNQLIRLVAYLWTLSNTLLGIACGFILCEKFQIIDGVCEIHSPTIARIVRRFPVPASAIALGHVLLARDQKTLGRTRTVERVHVRQYERWGIMFVPAYLLAPTVLFLQ